MGVGSQDREKVPVCTWGPSERNLRCACTTVLLYKEWNKVNFYLESGGDWNCGAGDTDNAR